jgi:hypothetical protein
LLLIDGALSRWFQNFLLTDSSISFSNDTRLKVILFYFALQALWEQQRGFSAGD